MMMVMVMGVRERIWRGDVKKRKESGQRGMRQVEEKKEEGWWSNNDCDYDHDCRDHEGE